MVQFEIRQIVLFICCAIIGVCNDRGECIELFVLMNR